MRSQVPWMGLGYLVLVLFGSCLAGWFVGVAMISYGMGIAVREFKEGGKA